MEDGEQDRNAKSRSRAKPAPRRYELDAGQPRQDIGQVSDAQLDAEWTAFHLRKRGLDPTIVNDERAARRPRPLAPEPDRSDER